MCQKDWLNAGLDCVDARARYVLLGVCLGMACSGQLLAYEAAQLLHLRKVCHCTPSSNTAVLRCAMPCCC